jgi:hypothetical protein
MSPGRWMRFTIDRTLWLMVISADCECLMNSRLRRSQIAHSIVLETDHRMGKLAEPLQRLARLRVAPFALESKWKRSQKR